MSDELRRRLRESVGTSAEAPVDEIVTRGRERRRRLRQRWVAGSGLVVLAIIAAVVVLSKSPTTQVHVSGGPTPSTAPQPTLAASSSSAVTQREVAIYAALLRHEIGQLMPTGTATSQSPSGSTFYVQNELFGLAPTATATDPNRFTTLTQAGPVSAAVQEGTVNAPAPIPIRFVPKVEADPVSVPSR